MTTHDFVLQAHPEFIQSMYEQYRRDPASVDSQWALFFAGCDLFESAPPIGMDSPSPDHQAEEHHDAIALVKAYRELGHVIADLDPLGNVPLTHPLLHLHDLGFEESDLGRTVSCFPFEGMERGTVGELLQALRQTYSRTIGVEYYHIRNKQERDWLQREMEVSGNQASLDSTEKKALLERLLRTETLETFLHSRFVGQKRFSVEGGESLIPLLVELVDDLAGRSVEQVVLGMPHRGRLNVLAHVMGKPYRSILAEFGGSFLPSELEGDGDVKYHLGYSHDVVSTSGRPIHLSLCPNPSHLEIVGPVVEGVVHAKQCQIDDSDRNRVVPVILHGDAAICGQGITYESLAASMMPGFQNGGSIHIIINNQIGFTATPTDYRVGRYPSGIARMFRAPIFHVNGDDPEAVVHVARLASAFRQKFHGHVFIDLVCFRRHGHNEIDDATFTSPVLYDQIARHPTVASLYSDRLQQEGVVSEDDVASTRDHIKRQLEASLAEANAEKPEQEVFAFGGAWKGLSWAGGDWDAKTRVEGDRLRSLATTLAEIPQGFTPHNRIRKLIDQRLSMVMDDKGIDWGCAEALAFATLLDEGTAIRLSGQDAARGTFSHRHAEWHDRESGATHVPFSRLGGGEAKIEIVNSLLSEAGVLGFEFGMSVADPHRLVIWEAQFGDFANVAQAVIDQLISGTESKWQRQSGLTLLLPHGLEGQGPEHSSARLERFLQLCANRNMQVLHPTTPAQLFHALRRQIHRHFRKPLVIMSPKSLLRHPEAISKLDAFTDNDFRSVLCDPRRANGGSVRRVLLCSGKVYYTLDRERVAREASDVALFRLEQLYPFPEAELRQALEPYGDVDDVVWVQEEPKNQGAFLMLRESLDSALGPGRTARYVGRDASATPATGSFAIHEREEKRFVEEAFAPREG